MTVPLRILDGHDAERADAVRSYLGRFSGSSESTRTMRTSLECVARLFPDIGADAATFPWELLADPATFDLVQQRVAESYGSATAVKHMTAVRGVLRHFARHDLADRPSVIVAIEGSPSITVQSRPTPAITTDELRQLLHATRQHPNAARAARDAALFSILAATGCRRAEIRQLSWSDLDRARGYLTFRRTKGGGARTVPVHPEAGRYLDAWREFSGGGSGPLFCAVRKNGVLVVDQAITSHQVWKLLRGYAATAGIADDVTPHSLRVWFVTSLLEHGTDLLTVTRAVGHANPNTTGRYDRRGDEAVRSAIALLEIPRPDDPGLDDPGPDVG